VDVDVMIDLEAWNSWVSDNLTAIRVVFIVVGALISRAIFRSTITRIIARVVSGAKRVAGGIDTEQVRDSAHAQARIVQRTRTLGSVLGTLTNWVIGVVATILVLSELGFEVTAIIAGAGILGAGLAVGAQDIVRDILNGIFMVFEDQIGVGDKVNVGDAEGVVE
jgi:small-conductance mechanosensitive channel